METKKETLTASATVKTEICNTVATLWYYEVMNHIPKIIHFIWFGESKKPPLVTKCIASWKKMLPDYEFIEWNEKNYDINKHTFLQKAFNEKKWAFLSDYIRLDVLHRYGGIYLDTDMEVIKPLDAMLKNGLFLGMESENRISAGIIGSIPGHWLIQQALHVYDHIKTYTPIPIILTDIFAKHVEIADKNQSYQDITIYKSEYFYPLPFGKKFGASFITPDSHTIHWWNYSWGPFYVRILLKLNIYEYAATLKRIFFTKLKE